MYENAPRRPLPSGQGVFTSSNGRLLVPIMYRRPLGVDADCRLNGKSSWHLVKKACKHSPQAHATAALSSGLLHHFPALAAERSVPLPHPLRGEGVTLDSQQVLGTCIGLGRTVCAYSLLEGYVGYPEGTPNSVEKHPWRGFGC